MKIHTYEREINGIKSSVSTICDMTPFLSAGFKCTGRGKQIPYQCAMEIRNDLIRRNLGLRLDSTQDNEESPNGNDHPT